MVIPARTGFQIRMMAKRAPNIPKARSHPQLGLPYRFTSRAKLTVEMERNRITNPTYKASAAMESTGFINNNPPITNVTIPKTRYQPQLSSCFLLTTENRISKIPENRKPRLNNMAKTRYELAGDTNAIIAAPINNKPTISGTYQSFSASDKGLRIKVFIRIN
jgi:hypothetical protein